MKTTTGYPTLKAVLREAGITGDEIREICGYEKLDTIYDRINGRKKEAKFSLVEMMDIHQYIKRRTGEDHEIGKLFDLDEGDREEAQNLADATACAWHYLAQRWDVDPHWGW